MFHEKRQELEEQQLHLNVGLNKIRLNLWISYIAGWS